MMSPQHLIEALQNHVALVKYKRDGTEYFKFFTYNAECAKISNGNLITVFNLITEEFEVITSFEVLFVSYGNINVNSILYVSFLKSKEKFKRFKARVAHLELDWMLILSNLINQVDMVFSNSITLELFLLFTLTKEQISGKRCNFTNVLGSFTTTLLSFVLHCLVEPLELTFISFRYTCINLLKLKAEAEMECIRAQWPALVSEFPETYPDELLYMESTMSTIVSSALHKFDRIREDKIQENWHKLIKIYYNCWPFILRPSLFEHLLFL